MGHGAGRRLAAGPWISTQFDVPAPPARFVVRPRLRAVLESAVDHPVTLVCGPAGSGKTTLLSTELGVPGEAARAWVSLSPAESDSGRFWTTVMASLRESGAAPDGSALHALAPPVRESARAFMPLFVNAAADVARPVLLVLDDLHVVRSRETLEQLAFLVLHAPPSIRLVLSTRSDPALPLHLLRVSGHLLEIRGADLAFTPEEAGELLAVHGVDLSEELVEALWARTEGWSAGLRLAALSLQDREDPAQFVEQFAGDDRAVGDYLVAEVLDRQSARLRRFLLQTSILERVSGRLADAVTAGEGGAETLDALEAGTGFLIGLDSRREWYRYHRLFASLLRARARLEIADELPELHRRAACWHAERGHHAQALHHALEATDWELAVQLAARHWFDLFVAGQGNSLRALVAALPAERLERDAELAAALACTALAAGDSPAARTHLVSAERAAPRLPPGRRRAYLETMALARLYLARRDGDFQAALAAADTLLHEAEDHGDWTHEARRALVHAGLGEAAFWAHRPERARAELTEAVQTARASALEYVEVGALSLLGFQDVLLQGPAAGAAHAAQAVALADRRGWGSIPQTALAHVALGVTVLCADMRPDDAEAHLARALDAIAGTDTRQTHFVVAHFTARLRAAQGRTQEGLDALARFEVSQRTGVPSMFERTGLQCMRARLLATLGDLPGARAALAEVQDEPWPVVRATGAQLCLAAGDPEGAVRLLEAYERPPDAHTIMALEAMVLLAVAHDEAGAPADASRTVEQALEEAERTGHRWPFVEAGRQIEGLLQRQIRQGTAHRAVVAEVLAALDDRLPARHAVAPMLEPLSPREEAILRYLPTTLSNREIASELFVTANTVKTHLRSIYRKLDVASRRDAVDRARDLRLLSTGLRR
jgi:LuxR family maltose regulon positive regulatory protein